jgi:hypothetical protein
MLPLLPFQMTCTHFITLAPVGTVPLPRNLMESVPDRGSSNDGIRDMEDRDTSDGTGMLY